jgi:hypothetical protein
MQKLSARMFHGDAPGLEHLPEDNITKRTLPPCRMMSAFGGKADMTWTRLNVRF